MSAPTGGLACENCGKRVLPTDTVCWHCGWKLPQRTAPVDLTLGPTTRQTAVAEPAPPPEFNLRAIAVSGALTLFLCVALLLVMRALGQRPLLVGSAGREFGDDWTALTDSQLRYTLGVPAAWQWLDVPFRDQQQVLEGVLRRQPIIGRVLNPLGVPADERLVEGLGLGTQALQQSDPAPFVVVATSPLDGQTDPQAVLDALAARGLALIDPQVDSSVPFQPRARFGLLNEDLGYQCQYLVLPNGLAGNDGAYLLAACAPQTQYAATERDLTKILNSFQLVEQ